MSDIEKGFTKEKLQELSSFRDVQSVTQQLSAIDERKVNPDDPESLKRRIRDIARREKLDIHAAHQAFRAELIQAGSDFLPIISRLSLLAGFDPVRVQVQNDAHANDLAALERVRRDEPYMYNQIVALISVGSRPFASAAQPLGDASNIERTLLRLQENVTNHVSGEIGMDAGEKFFTGTIPSADVLVFDEPKIVHTDQGIDIDYKLPTRLTGIVDVKNSVPREDHIEPSHYGDLFTAEDGVIIAHPSLEELANTLRPRPEYSRLSMSPYFGRSAILRASADSWYDYNERHGSHRRGRLSTL